MSAARLSESPYGAPELLESARPHLSRALAASSLLGLLLFAVAWWFSSWIGPSGLARKAPMPRVEIVPILEHASPPTIRTEAPPDASPSLPRNPEALPVPVPDAQASPEQTLAEPGETGQREHAITAGEGAGIRSEPVVGPVNDPGEVPLVDQLPEPIRRPHPEYPEIARQAQVEGLVVVHVLVGRDGRVKDVVLHPKSNVAVLNPAAIEAARSWTFQPAIHEGRAVEVWVALPFRFRLR